MPARETCPLHRTGGRRPSDDEGQRGSRKPPTASLQPWAEAVEARGQSRWRAGTRSCQVGRSQPAPGRELSAGRPGEQTRKLTSFQGSRVDERDGAGGPKYLTLGKEQTGSRMQLEQHRYPVTERVRDSGMPGSLAEGQPGVQQARSVSKVQLQRRCGCRLPAVLCLELGLEVTASLRDPGRWAALEHQVLPGGPAAVTSFPGAFLGPVL